MHEQATAAAAILATKTAPPAAAEPTKTPPPVQGEPSKTPPAVKGEETKTEAPKVEEKPKDSVRFAQLAKKERGIVLEKQRLAQEREKQKVEREAFATERKEFDAWKTFKSEAKLNPLAALESLGVTYEELSEFMLSDKKATPDMAVKAVKDELESFKRQQEEEKKKAIEQERERIAAEQKKIVEAFHAEVVDFVKQNSAKYELTNIHEATGLVVSVIEENFAKTQRVMSAGEAADLVEKYLEEQIQKSLATEKLKARASPQPQVADKRPEPAQQRTLTNGLTSSTPAFNSSQLERDRMQRAMAALERTK